MRYIETHKDVLEANEPRVQELRRKYKRRVVPVIAYIHGSGRPFALNYLVTRNYDLDRPCYYLCAGEKMRFWLFEHLRRQEVQS